MRAGFTTNVTVCWAERGDRCSVSLTVGGSALSTGRLSVLVAEQRLVSAGSELTGCSQDTVTVRLGGRGMTRSMFRPFDPALRILTPGGGVRWTLLASAWTRAESWTSWVAYSGLSCPP